MGMFDDLTCLAPLPDGYDATRGFQTKDFACEMDRYEIRENGELWKLNHPWWANHETTQPERVKFHGVLRFYGYDRRGLPPLAPHDPERWHEYDAKFTDGVLVGITEVSAPELATSPGQSGDGGEGNEPQSGAEHV